MSDQWGIHESFLWENKSWDFSYSDDHSGGSNEKSNSMILTPGTEVMASGKKQSKNGKGSGEMKEGNGGGGDSDHEIHIWTERERRKKMRTMFSTLHALLPQLPPKSDKSTIVDEAVNYIQTLQHTLQKLQKQKLERLQDAATINNFDTSIITQQKLAMDSREAFLADQGSSSCDNYMPMLTTTNSFSLSRFATTFQTWSSPNVIFNVCGDQAHISVCSTKKPGLLTTICFVLEKYKLEVVSAHVSSEYNRSMYMIQVRASGAPDQFPETFSVEEIYKQAAAEIMSWVSC